jgi:hypothetical protein
VQQFIPCYQLRFMQLCWQSIDKFLSPKLRGTAMAIAQGASRDSTSEIEKTKQQRVAAISPIVVHRRVAVETNSADAQRQKEEL